MIAQTSLQSAQLRLTQHYLKRLQGATASARLGPDSRLHWYQLVRRDWEQIKRGQAWSAQWNGSEMERARLCVAFTLGTTDMLRLQLTPAEELIWVQQALDAARRLNDGQIVRTLLYQVIMLNLTLEVLDTVDHCTQQLLELAEAANDIISQGRALHTRGTANFVRGRYDLAEEAYLDSLALFESCNAIEEMLFALRGLGRIAQFRGDYKTANSYHRRYLETAQAISDDLRVLDARISLSGVALSLREYAQAEAYARQATEMARMFGRTRILPPALLSLAHAQKWQGKLDSACECYEEAISIARTFCPPSTICNGLYGLGQAAYQQGNYPKAKSCFEEALTLARSVNHATRICEIANDKVYVHIACNEAEEAIDQLAEALTSALQIGTPHFLAKALAAALTLWLYLGKTEQAAIWAATLSGHTQLLHPSLFDMTTYKRLEDELGQRAYEQALLQGKACTLEQTATAIEQQLFYVKQ